MTDGIRIYLERVASMGEIPFSMNIPNLETEAAINDVRSGKVFTAKDKADLFAQLRA
jgi:antitoxin component of RelBE/YafQ-DinJ toxin-antitoxin module